MCHTHTHMLLCDNHCIDIEIVEKKKRQFIDCFRVRTIFMTYSVRVQGVSRIKGKKHFKFSVNSFVTRNERLGCEYGLFYTNSTFFLKSV